MKKMMIAVAMAIALPAAAYAQATPAPAPKAAAHAGHNMQAMNCKDMHAMMASGSGQTDHSKMDHSNMDHSKMAQGCSDTAKAGAKASGEHESHKGH